MLTIVGAGLAGLVAAHAFPGARVVEAAPQPQESHKALLRFRSDAVARLTGIDFKPVTVRKGVWFEDDFVEPDIRLANLYAQKTLGRVIDRSIWDTETTTRWVAPEDFYDRLIDHVGARIEWGTHHNFGGTVGATISTAPMPVTLKALGYESSGFHRAPIHVKRFRVDGADVYQTVYFPSGDHTMYRASITGDLAIVEFAGEPRGAWASDLCAAFGLSEAARLESLGEVEQKYGKIAPIEARWRRATVARLTTEHEVYSLGRFATWRNILLDDVVDDIKTIKRLMASDEHERRLVAAK